MYIHTIIIHENDNTKVLKRFLDMSRCTEHSFNNFHSFLFICKDIDPVEFGHQYVKKIGLRAIEGYPINEIETSRIKDIIHNKDRHFSNKIVFNTVTDELDEKFVYDEFTFPESYENYNFYKIDVMLYENESKKMQWGINWDRDVIITGWNKKSLERMIVNN